jgi:hypothetical protein
LCEQAKLDEAQRKVADPAVELALPGNATMWAVRAAAFVEALESADVLSCILQSSDIVWLASLAPRSS